MKNGKTILQKYEEIFSLTTLKKLRLKLVIRVEKRIEIIKIDFKQISMVDNLYGVFHIYYINIILNSKMLFEE